MESGAGVLDRYGATAMRGVQTGVYRETSVALEDQGRSVPSIGKFILHTALWHPVFCFHVFTDNHEAHTADLVVVVGVCMFGSQMQPFAEPRFAKEDPPARFRNDKQGCVGSRPMCGRRHFGAPWAVGRV